MIRCPVSTLPPTFASKERAPDHRLPRCRHTDDDDDDDDGDTDDDDDDDDDGDR